MAAASLCSGVNEEEQGRMERGSATRGTEGEGRRRRALCVQEGAEWGWGRGGGVKGGSGQGNGRRPTGASCAGGEATAAASIGEVNRRS